MAKVINKELLIIGAGPAGLKAGEFCAEKKVDYLILERGQVGQGWRDVRPAMPLLSPCHPQRDWTSLSSKFPIWKLPVKRPYCDAGDFVDYMQKFADHYQLDIATNTTVVDITFDGDYYVVSTAGKQIYKAPFLLVATGIFSSPFIPPIPGVENNPIVRHSHNYQSADEHKRQRVLVVGAGNSAAEIAIEMAGHSMVYMISRKDLQYFADTKKLYHIRGISESYLKELISMEIIRYRAYQDILKVENQTVFFKDWTLEVDQIYFATGYLANIGLLKNFDLRVNKRRYPEVSYSGESIQYPNLFFAGPLAFHSTASIVIHGFIKNVPYTVERIIEKLRAPSHIDKHAGRQ